MTDYLHTANHEMSPGIEDVHKWLNDVWSYMKGRRLLTQVDPAYNIDMPNLILERGVLRLTREDVNYTANYYKLVGMKNRRNKSMNGKFILIGSELIRSNTFDTQQAQGINEGINKKKKNKTGYDEKEHWQERYNNLVEALDFIDFIMVPPMPEKEIENYRKLGKRVIIIPIVCNAEQKPNLHSKERENNKLIDFCITGTMTSHRKEIVNKLRQKGHTVVVRDARTPNYIREELYNTSWIDICPLLNENTRLVSTMKAKYNLDRNHLHLFEKPKNDEFCKLDILNEVRYNKGDFVEEASEMLEHVKKRNIKYSDNRRYVENSKIRGEKFFAEYIKMIKNR